jgi:lambda family phage portal protein
MPTKVKDATPRRPRDATARAKPSATFMRDLGTPYLAPWRPALREVSDDVRQSWAQAAARAIDMIQNSGWISGAVDQSIAYTIGAGLRLASKPDAAALGWTADEAQQWAHDVERRWEAWANRPIECDVEGKASVGKMQAQAMRSHFAYGEVLATLPFVKRQGCQYGTKVQMLPPLRLAQDTNPPTMVQGVIRDATGFPLAYRIKKPPTDYAAPAYRDIPARDPWGRSQVVHVFDGSPGQARGIAPITPALRVVRQFDQLSDATLTAALLQTIFAATVTSPQPTEEVLAAFQDLVEQQASRIGTTGDVPTPIEAMMASRQGWYDQTQIDLGRHGKVAHLAPGDEMALHRSEHPNATFEAFAKFLLREIARCLALTYEDFTGDYAGATYSSVRMATSAMWMITVYRRVNIIAPFLNPIFEAWLEEDIENGWTPFPGGVDGYIANRAAATRAHWRGPAKPQADDAKFANAIKTLRSLGVITDEWICGEMGEDWEDVYEQRKREKDKRQSLDLPDGNGAAPAQTASNEPGNGENEPGAAGDGMNADENPQGLMALLQALASRPAPTVNVTVPRGKKIIKQVEHDDNGRVARIVEHEEE